MSLYDRIADLPLEIEGYDLEFRERNCAGDFARISVLLSLQDERPETPGFTRPSTHVSLRGGGESGLGEDVTYDAADHRAFVEAPAALPLPGTYTVEEFSATLEEIDLFPTAGPAREASRAYRRWAFESAALDLALKQAGTDLATVLDRNYDPVRFLVSTRLGDSPTIDRVERWLDIDSDLEFKLDATSAWTPDLVNALAATGAVRIVDLKGHYHGTMVDQSADSALYRSLVEALPDTLIEDPILTGGTRSLFEGCENRISWDATITDAASVEALPFTPEWINVKPSRCGSVERLFGLIEHCLDEGIGMYGGGQTELGVGRQHLHALASLFYPDAPNDVAPRAYNDPEPSVGLPTSPLSPPERPRGFEWKHADWERIESR